MMLLSNQRMMNDVTLEYFCVVFIIASEYRKAYHLGFLPPQPRRLKAKKFYNRKKSAHARKDDFGMSVFCLC